jgi:hypothetical protein
MLPPQMMIFIFPSRSQTSPAAAGLRCNEEPLLPDRAMDKTGTPLSPLKGA